MKISKYKLMKQLRPLFTTVLFIVLFFLNSKANQAPSIDGKALFEVNCAKCHKTNKPSTGPALKDSRVRWEEATGSTDEIYNWIKNSQSLIDAGLPYAVALKSEWKTVMTNFPQLSKDQMDAILDYADNDVEEELASSSSELVIDDSIPDSGFSDDFWIWFSIAVLFIIIIAYVGSVKRQLKDAIDESNGRVFRDKDLTLSERLSSWIWRNRVSVGIFGFIGLVSVLVTLFIWGNETVGIYEGYKPSQPIEFSHAIHAGQQGIACQYCHNTASISKSASVPSVNVCMNCHKAIPEGKKGGAKEISKIYEAAGFDGKFYTKEQKPIKWNKVHVLPDHVFFSHQQHIVVGGIDCKQCHGDMTKQTVAKIMSIEELNNVDGNIKLHKPTLTMGWCIECHGEKGITTKGGTGYYEDIHNRLVKFKPELLQEYLGDDKVTVKELGGWECGKCHY